MVSPLLGGWRHRIQKRMGKKSNSITNTVDVELHPYFFNVINLFVFIKYTFFRTIFFLYQIYSLSGF